ncbi:MAG: M16 family metallopeptidase [Phycisphaerales bacterium]
MPRSLTSALKAGAATLSALLAGPALLPAVGAAGMALAAPGASAQQVNVEVFTLDNGMKFLLYPRTEEPNIIAAGWVAKVGSVNERPGITGISHFFEHMMFKGTDTIGTKDPTKDREVRTRQTEVRQKLMNLQLGSQYKRWKAGEIDDPWDIRNDTPEMKALREELARLMEEQKSITVPNEFDKVYTNLGASGMNAFTEYDMTFYIISVPANKFEMWAWMESDRLTNSVFREFYAERDVVHEERRMRTESTPTGIYQEQFDSMFWQSSPYHWPVIGWTSDLNSYTMADAQAYYDTYYGCNNIVGVVVGDFKSDELKPVIKKYFERLKPSAQPVPPVVTLEMPQLAEQRMYAECDCQPSVEVRYKTVPFNHADSFALAVMADVLNGRTGRLYKSMTEGKQIANDAAAGQEDRKYGGYFSFGAEVKGEATPEQLEAGWYEELERLKKELVSERELQKVKNQSAANDFRRLQNTFFLMIQIGWAEAKGGWEYLNTSPARVQAVTAEDIQRVANKYFEPKNRSVAIYKRKPGSAPAGEDPEFTRVTAKMPGPMKSGMKKQLEMITKETDAAKLKEGLAQFEGMKAQLPEEMKPVGEFLVKKIQERIAELEKAAK